MGIHVGLKIGEVAHDHQVSVKNYVTNELHLINSYDTWHGKYFLTAIVKCNIVGIYTGTKNIAAQLKKITVGKASLANKTWFPQLSDKRRFIGSSACIHVCTMCMFF